MWSENLNGITLFLGLSKKSLLSKLRIIAFKARKP
jgi:hypothetical protein